MEFLIIMMIGIGIFFLVYGLVRVPGTTLNKKFVQLGALKGKDYNEICCHVGQPYSMTTRENGTVCQWITSGYHISLVFDNDNICQGVIHESRA